MSTETRIEIHAGTEVGQACKMLARTAAETGTTCVAEFNGQTLTARPGDHPDRVFQPYADWMRRCDKEREARQATDRRKLAAFPAMLEALRKIAAAGPETDPHDDEDYDDQEGAYGAGIDAANWECASIARAALAAAERTT